MHHYKQYIYSTLTVRCTRYMIRRGTQGHAEAHRGTQRHAEARRDTQRHAETRRDTQRDATTSPLSKFLFDYHDEIAKRRLPYLAVAPHEQSQVSLSTLSLSSLYFSHYTYRMDAFSRGRTTFTKHVIGRASIQTLAGRFFKVLWYGKRK